MKFIAMASEVPVFRPRSESKSKTRTINRTLYEGISSDTSAINHVKSDKTVSVKSSLNSTLNSGQERTTSKGESETQDTASYRSSPKNSFSNFKRRNRQSEKSSKETEYIKCDSSGRNGEVASHRPRLSASAESASVFRNSVRIFYQSNFNSSS